MHGAVETVGLLRVTLAQQRPSVCRELSRSAGLPRVAERSAGSGEHAGQAVHDIRRIAGLVELRVVPLVIVGVVVPRVVVLRVVVPGLSRHG